MISKARFAVAVDVAVPIARSAVNEPVCVGVPVIAPVLGLMLSPAGSPVDPAQGQFRNTATVLHQPLGNETPTPP